MGRRLEWILGLLLGGPFVFGAQAPVPAAPPKPPLCKKIVEVPLGEFGDKAAAKRFTKKFAGGRLGAVREDTQLKFIGDFKTKKRCNFGSNYFSGLHYIESSDFVLLETLEGSETKLALWDIAACKLIWDGKKFGATGQPVWYRDREVIFRPTCWDCNARPAEEPCGCDAAIVLKMKPNCEFTVDAAESQNVTRKEIGVAFKGHKKVVRRFTPQAQIVK